MNVVRFFAWVDWTVILACSMLTHAVLLVCVRSFEQGRERAIVDERIREGRA